MSSHEDDGLSEQRCPACLCLVPVSTIVQRYGMPICEACADEQDEQREYEYEQLLLSERTD